MTNTEEKRHHISKKGERHRGKEETKYANNSFNMVAKTDRKRKNVVEIKPGNVRKSRWRKKRKLIGSPQDLTMKKKS